MKRMLILGMLIVVLVGTLSYHLAYRFAVKRAQEWNSVKDWDPRLPKDPSPETLLATNRHEPNGDVRVIPIPTSLYCAMFTVYSQQFADRYRFPKDKVVALSKGMDAIEFRIITIGGENRLFIPILVQQELNLDLPIQDDFVQRNLQEGRRFVFPERNISKPLPSKDKVLKEAVLKEEKYYAQNVWLSNQGGKERLDAMVVETSKVFMPGYDYMLLEVAANVKLKTFFSEPDVCVSVKKKNSTEVCRMIIPQELIAKALPLLEEMGVYDGWRKDAV